MKLNEKGKQFLHFRASKSGTLLGIYRQKTKSTEIEKTRRQLTREVFQKSIEIGGERGRTIEVAEKSTTRQEEKLTILGTVPDQGWIQKT